MYFKLEAQGEEGGREARSATSIAGCSSGLSTKHKPLKQHRWNQSEGVTTQYNPP